MAEAATNQTQAPAVVTEKPNLPAFGASLDNDIRATERIEMQRVTAMVYAANQRAMQYPRNEKVCEERILKACENVNFAADALYKVPRGNQLVEGLTVKALREFARLWGNMQTGVVSHGSYGNCSQFGVIGIDLETNYMHENAYTVQHARWISDPKKAEGGFLKPVYDPQSINELCKAQNSKERRNAISAILPYWLEEKAIMTVKRTLWSAVTDVPAAWNACKLQFDKWGVKPASLCRVLNKTLAQVDKMDAADIVELRLLKDSIKEGGVDLLDAIFPERDKTKAAPTKKEEESSTAQQTNQAVAAKPTSTSSTKPSSSKPASQGSSGSQPTSENSPSGSSKTASPEKSQDGNAASQSTATKSISTQKPAGKPKSTEPTTQEVSGESSKQTSTVTEISTKSEQSQEDDAKSSTCSKSCPENCPNHEQMNFSLTEESDENETHSEEEHQNQSESEDESTQEQEDDNEDLADEIQDEDAF